MRIPASSAQLEIHGSALVRPGFDSQTSQVRLRAGSTSSRSSASLATAISSSFRCAFALAHLPCTHAALSEPARPLSALTKPPARVSHVCSRSVWLPQSPPPSPLPSPPPLPLFLPSKPPPLVPCLWSRQAPIRGSTFRTSRWRAARRAGACSVLVRFGCAAARSRAPPLCHRMTACRAVRVPPAAPSNSQVLRPHALRSRQAPPLTCRAFAYDRLPFERARDRLRAPPPCRELPI